MATKREEIIQKALQILKNNPNGVRYSYLVRKIKDELPHININTIHGTIWNLDIRIPGEVFKPDKGLFRHIIFKEDESIEKEEITELETEIIIKEEEFYKPFADWLVNELEECTKAIPLGGNKFKDKWGTPDIIGIRKSRKSDVLEFPTEIICAEIKLDTGNLITAFGQACSYKLFSHKSYIVIPKSSQDEDVGRIDALCRIFGIGLILFDNKNPIYPQFEIRVRASKNEPDMFYVNKYLRIIEDDLF
ncbi:MAG: hypothetical protein FJ134_11440 [Deltaproteobacteria bacterium]|nr:hypothetical protein [Deltaproteobacteria bacterium]